VFLDQRLDPPFFNGVLPYLFDDELKLFPKEMITYFPSHDKALALLEAGSPCDLVIFSQELFGNDLKYSRMFPEGTEPARILAAYRNARAGMKFIIVSTMEEGMEIGFNIGELGDDVKLYVPFGGGDMLVQKIIASEVGERGFFDSIRLNKERQRMKISSLIDDMIGSHPKGIGRVSDEVIQALKMRGGLNDEQAERIAARLQQIHELQKEDAEEMEFSRYGFTSTTSFALGDMFFKADKPERLFLEDDVYSAGMEGFSLFMPQKKAFAYDRETGVLVLENAFHGEPGYSRANRTYGGMLKRKFGCGFSRHGLPYNLFLMGLFHKEATASIAPQSLLLYQGAHGLPHEEEGNTPLVNESGMPYRRFERTGVSSGRVRPIIADYRSMQEEIAASAVHGDWKKDNLPNGLLVDYSMFGLGLELDDLAYYLSDERFRMDLARFHRAIDFYIELREMHDPVFGMVAADGYRKFLHEHAYGAFLSQLVLRHSVMNKRDLADPEKYRQREYYQSRISEMLERKRLA
jgi:hypothetical protein